MEKFSFEKSRERAAKMTEIIESGEAVNYDDAERLLETENLDSRLDPKLHEVLDKVDFSILRGVYEEKIRSLGIIETSGNFIEQEKFGNMTNSGAFLGQGGVYRNEEKDVLLSKMWPELLAKVTEDQTFENIVFSIVCHEETHAVSHQSCSDWEPSTRLTDRQGKMIGFQKGTKTRLFGKFVLHGDASYVMFNEGVTDMIGEEVYDTYKSKDESFLAEEVSGKALEYNRLYSRGRKLVATIIDKISTECELEANDVWRAIQRGYFAGEDLGGENMKRLFQDVASWLLHKNLELADSEFALSGPVAIKQIEYKTWSDDDKKRIRRWFKHLNETALGKEGS